MGFERMVEQNWTKKDAFQRNGRLGFGQKKTKTKTDRIKWEFNKRQNRFMTKKDGV